MTDTELNERLALKAGYKQLAFNNDPTQPSKLWRSPDNNYIFCPDYTHDLNACMRDITPLLIERGISKIIFIYKNDITWCEFEKTNKERSWVAEIEAAETEALAFCEAAWKFLSE
jgi:hypothetical protein